jgi:hypothetical protein
LEFLAKSQRTAGTGGGMSEESTMYEELGYWSLMIARMRKMAIEMESGEQDEDYVTTAIRNLFIDIERNEPDERGIRDSYHVDFEDPDNRNRKLVFKFYCYIDDEIPF